MRITDVIRRKGAEVVTVRPDHTVAELLALLAEHRIGALVVSADGAGVDGIVSERDVVRTLHSQRGGGPGPAGLGPDDRRRDDLRAGRRRRAPDAADDRQAYPAHPRGRRRRACTASSASATWSSTASTSCRSNATSSWVTSTSSPARVPWCACPWGSASRSRAPVWGPTACRVVSVRAAWAWCTSGWTRPAARWPSRSCARTSRTMPRPAPGWPVRSRRCAGCGTPWSPRCWTPTWTATSRTSSPASCRAPAWTPWSASTARWPRRSCCRLGLGPVQRAARHPRRCTWCTATSSPATCWCWTATRWSSTSASRTSRTTSGSPRPGW